MRWLFIALVFAACSKDPRNERLSPDRQTYSFAEREGTTSAPELYTQASLKLAQNDVAAARKLYQRAIDLEPQKPMGYIGLGSCDLREQQLEEARRLYEKGAALDPTSSSAQVGLGSVASLQGRHRDAANLYERGVALDEGSADAHWGAAISYEQLGDRERMHVHARRFIALAPTSMLATRAAKMLLQ